MIYFLAPVVIGWAIAITAARQRLKLAWPVISLAVIALIAGSAQVNAIRPAADNPGGVSMSFYVGAALRNGDGLLHIVMYFALTAVPYLVWWFRNVRSIFATDAAG